MSHEIEIFAAGASFKTASFTFPAGELQVQIPGIPRELRGDITLLARLQSAEDVLRLCLAAEIVGRIRVVGRRKLAIPYLPYARQDRVMQPHEAFSLKAVAKIINGLGFDEVAVYDPHSDVTAALIENIRVISQLELIRAHSGLARPLKGLFTTIVAPDAGAARKAFAVAQAFSLPFVTASKLRDVRTGQITRTEIHGTDAVYGRDCLIVDDICDGGRTFIELAKALREAGADKGFVRFQAHDFSFRGMSGPQDAALSGAAHLTSFVGTDTVSAIDLIEDYYNGDAEAELIGCSVPATEHSVMSMGGQESELETFRRLITRLYPAGIVSIVSDTWDFWKVITEFTVALKNEILARPGKLVFRPDSGDPVKIICGDPDAEPGSPAHKGAVECLWDIFGGTVTEKGYRVLDGHVGLIYGDSITLSRAHAILAGLAAKGFASSNLVLGVGSFTYQYATRDNYGFAVKSTYGEVNGQGREIYKDPKTDNGVKKSARGLLKVIDEDGELCLADRQGAIDSEDCNLRPVFRDGKLLVDDSIAEIRGRLAA